MIKREMTPFEKVLAGRAARALLHRGKTLAYVVFPAYGMASHFAVNEQPADSAPTNDKAAMHAVLKCEPVGQLDGFDVYEVRYQSVTYLLCLATQHVVVMPPVAEQKSVDSAELIAAGYMRAINDACSVAENYFADDPALAGHGHSEHLKDRLRDLLDVSPENKAGGLAAAKLQADRD